MKMIRAAASAFVGLSLVVSGVLAATSAPLALTHGAMVSTVAGDKTAVGSPNDNHGGAVSAVAHGQGSADSTSTTVTTVTTGARGTHGAAVSVVAKDPTQVGGTNSNHGGAVSTVARGTHGRRHKNASGTHRPKHPAPTGAAGSHPGSH